MSTQKNSPSNEAGLSVEEQLLKANETITSMLTLEQAVSIVPSMFTAKQLAALSAKYVAKFDKFPAVKAQHRESFPQFSENLSMLYMLSWAQTDADNKIASDTRDENISLLIARVSGYIQGDVITDTQDAENRAIDMRIAELRAVIGFDKTGELLKVLKGARESWIRNVDHVYSKAQDNKLRRACHIFGTTLEALA